ncbi:MAG: YicC family protein [Deltaproteobacteria bacterium]|nr:YicC family protein [Deltaproteobacteria bacterium]
MLSMTGFGRSSREVQGLGLEVEARSVNHRHLDLRVRLPRILSDREAPIKQRIQGRMTRGKVDVTINLSGLGTAERIAIDDAIAAQYVEASRLLRERHDLADTLDVASLLALPGVTRIVESELDPDVLLGPIDEAVDEAIDNLIAMRSTEGATLAQEIGGRLKTVERLALAFEARSGEVLSMARRRLQKRAEQIKQEVGLLDDARLHQEIVIAADRLDITEELVRLRSHVAQFRDIMDSADSGKSVGRRLDFLLQELGREANTVGSKANDAPLAQDVVELKTELERIREQVQNVE